MFAADPLGILAFLWLLFGSKDRTTAPSSAPPRSTTPYLPASTPPWPQVTPSGLPSFPGSGWEYDEPPPAVVKQRAGQLVKQLWAGGKNTFKTEQTAGRWITYRAEILRGGNQGVVAYRVKQGKPAALPPATAGRPAPAPAPRPAATPVSSETSVQLKKGRAYGYVAKFDSTVPVDAAAIAKGLALAGAWQVSVDPGPPIMARYRNRAAADVVLYLGRPIKLDLGGYSGTLTLLQVTEVPDEVPTELPRGVPSSAPAPAPGVVLTQTPAPALTRQLPDLKYGDGLKPKAPIEEVKIVQQRLHVTPVDGRFGPDLRAAVIEFQVQTGLAPNISRPELVKRGFGAVKKATWEKLFSVQA